jgi:hypothetical protein
MSALDDVASELYSLSPAEFTAARNQRASSETKGGDRQLGASIRRLPKPSVAAWAVNMLVRHRSDEVEALLELGDRLREAQDDLDSDAIRSLGRERHRMLSAIATSARGLGGELGTAVSESAAIEVQQTLQAAMGDAAAAAAVRSGALVRTFSGSGLDPVDLDGAVAVPVEAGGDGLSSGAGLDAFDEIGARRRLKNRVGASGRSARDAEGAADEGESADGDGHEDGDDYENVEGLDGDSPRSTRPRSGKAAGSSAGERTNGSAAGAKGAGSGSSSGGKRAGSSRGKTAGGAEAAASDQAAERRAREDERARAREQARAEAKAEAKREAEETRQDAEDAQAEVATLDLRIRDLIDKRDRLSQQLRNLKDQVEAVQDELSETESARAAARRERLSAQRAADAAQRAADRSRRRLDSLH